MRKALELSEKLSDIRQEQDLPPEPKPLPKVQKQAKPEIPPKPTMTAEAARQRHTLNCKRLQGISQAERNHLCSGKERNALEEKQDSLKGLSKLTKKGDLQSEIDRINERIDLLKVGLSGIAKRYGYQTVQDFYRAYHTAKNAYVDYQEKAAKWEQNYGSKSKSDSVYKRIKNYQKETAEGQTENTTQRKDRDCCKMSWQSLVSVQFN